MKFVLAEKPSVARAIAEVIGAKKRKKGYFEGNDYVVSWCIGHLVELAQPEDYKEQWKKWNYESLPILPDVWQHVVKKNTKEQYEVLYKLFHQKDVLSIINACDSGREGELIFRLVYKMAECQKPIERLWLSSMEESAIKEGFKDLTPGSDYENLYHAALCRQKADWLVGMNGTRLFTVLYRSKILKVGRVQTPTLAMLVERENQIMEFQKKPYYVVHILCDSLDAVTERIETKEQAEAITKECSNGQAVVSAVVRVEKVISSPKLYDLTTLQRDVNSLFSFTAKQTLEYTQSLYEKKLVTYPRTDSQYLSDDMEQTVKEVSNAIFQVLSFEKDKTFKPDISKILNSKKVTDHHAIIPTIEILKTNLSTIPEAERKILSLIACRLLCGIGENHVYETVKVKFLCNGHEFMASEKSVKWIGWKRFEDMLKNSFKVFENLNKEEKREKKLLEVLEGQVFEKIQANVSEHFTSPPKAYTESSLLLAMEKAGSEDIEAEVERKGLGTPATRADIIEKLVKDGFVKREKKQLIPTEDGIKLITILPEMIKSPKLTADWENSLALVAKGEKDMVEFMREIENMVSKLVQTYHAVGDEQKNMFAPKQEVLGICPNCKGQVVKGKFGAYCVKKCGMNVGRVMGAILTDAQVKDMLAGKKILLKGLKNKIGKSYDAYIIPEGIEEYCYSKKGKEKRGMQFKVKIEFSKKKI